MTEDDILAEQPEHRAATAVHTIHSCIYDLAEMVAEGQGRIVDAEFANLNGAKMQIENLLTYLQVHRQAAA